MNVRELIEHLKGLDPEAIVVVRERLLHVRVLRAVVGIFHPSGVNGRCGDFLTDIEDGGLPAIELR